MDRLDRGLPWAIEVRVEVVGLTVFSNTNLTTQLSFGPQNAWRKGCAQLGFGSFKIRYCALRLLEPPGQSPDPSPQLLSRQLTAPKNLRIGVTVEPRKHYFLPEPFE